MFLWVSSSCSPIDLPDQVLRRTYSQRRSAWIFVSRTRREILGFMFQLRQHETLSGAAREFFLNKMPYGRPTRRSGAVGIHRRTFRTDHTKVFRWTSYGGRTWAEDRKS